MSKQYRECVWVSRISRPISTPRSSTSALIRSNEITPQERKRRKKGNAASKWKANSFSSPSRLLQMLITGTFTKSLAIWLQKAICHTRILSCGNGRHVFETRCEEGINFDTFWKEPINAVWSNAYARLELDSSESQNKYFRFSLTDASQSNSVRTHWGMLTFDTNCWYFDILFIRLITNFSNALNLVTASSFIVKKWNDDIQKQIKPVLRRYKNDFVAPLQN